MHPQGPAACWDTHQDTAACSSCWACCALLAASVALVMRGMITGGGACAKRVDRF